jgi:hypothetical protein
VIPVVFHHHDQIGDRLVYIFVFFVKINTVAYVSDLYTDSPVLLSFPHFYMGDPRLRAAVEGMDEPDPELHEFYLDVQPVSTLTRIITFPAREVHTTITS